MRWLPMVCLFRIYQQDCVIDGMQRGQLCIAGLSAQRLGQFTQTLTGMIQVLVARQSGSGFQDQYLLTLNGQCTVTPNNYM